MQSPLEKFRTLFREKFVSAGSGPDGQRFSRLLKAPTTGRSSFASANLREPWPWIIGALGKNATESGGETPHSKTQALRSYAFAEWVEAD
jgi:hypothetical protein